MKTHSSSIRRGLQPGYGKYAKSSVNEFWAKTIAKAVHRKADKYTKCVKSIVKKYDL